MKTLTMSPTSDESLRMLSSSTDSKSTKIQEILGLNDESGNIGNTNTSESRWASLDLFNVR